MCIVHVQSFALCCFCICTIIKLQIRIDIIFTYDQRKESVRKVLLLELFLVQRMKRIIESVVKRGARGGGQSVGS